MDLRKEVEEELERNRKVLTARVNRSAGFQETALVKSRILSAERALRLGGKVELTQALNKLGCTND